MNPSSAYIHSPEAIPDWSLWPVPSPQITKIVIGKLDETLKGGNLPPDFAERFPKLKVLHLWGLEELQTLPELPAGLVELDVRRSQLLAKIDHVPGEFLDTLILEECRNLTSVVSLYGKYPVLRDLSFKDCAALSETTIQYHLERAAKLEKFDASGCVKLKQIEHWPPGLVDVRLDGCPELDCIPNWPLHLRRLQLRGSAIPALDDFPASLDYIDLGGMRNLSALPEDWGNPRTLFLFGSGILMPPASEHGENHDENVAKRTRAYFDDVELTGTGDVKRCKLLVLGNGSAGKTCFSLNLVGDDPKRTRKDYEPKEDRLGTTHGIQFHDKSVKVPIGGKPKPVHLHLWDFGGQEIYHNTHRLFMSTGAVFVVMWNPEQVEGQPASDASGHADNWRPLRYWLDYIALACPQSARIAIVCSGRTETSPEIEWLLAKDSGEDQIREKHDVFFIDSLEQLGEMDEFQDWLRKGVRNVVNTQGSAVPTYWEIAQDLVERWLQRFKDDAVFAAAHQRLDAAAFGSLLEDEIKNRTQDGKDKHFKKLGEAVLAERPFMTEDRIRRTLAFLTHSGWIYWHPSLTGGKAIIGQKWALDNIYTILERVDGEDESVIYLRLMQKHGRFTMKDLERWGWDGVPEEEDRKLLISFMERIGLCVRLIKSEELVYGEPEYLSLAHLQVREASGLESTWKDYLHDLPTDLSNESMGNNTTVIENKQLHSGHWDQILGSLADQFGTDAEYARNGFLAKNKEGQTVYIAADLNHRGLGGKLMVDVIGPNASELEEKIGKTISAFVKGQIARIGIEDDVAKAAGERDHVTTVFFSYTWQPKDSNTSKREIPEGYEKPVDLLYEALDKLRPRIVPIRDKFMIRHGDSITEHNQRIKKCDKVIIIHSDKYWKSAFCMDELTMFVDSLLTRPKMIQSVLVVIGHHQTEFDRPGKPSRGPFKPGRAKKDVYDFWDSFDPTEMHPMLEKSTTASKLKDAVRHLINNQIPTITDLSMKHEEWEDSKADEIIDRVIEHVQKKFSDPDDNE